LRALKTLFLVAALMLAIEAPKPFLRQQEPVTAPVRIAYGPSPGFESIDPELIGRARKTIDMAAYVLTDQRVIREISAAADRGVRVRIYFDAEQFRQAGGGNDNVQALTRQPNVLARIKAENNDLMHLKAYAVDGRWLRTGSTNFSWSGETRQDNDLIVIDSPGAVEDFTRQFEKLWSRRDNQDAGK
jgi:phosphatidylserine/phosphatidylglycerophosphate/cardiolipin synthase-like enzyme